MDGKEHIGKGEDKNGKHMGRDFRLEACHNSTQEADKIR